jgi:hypothetical protein
VTADPAIFAAIFAALYAAHELGDHWVQTDHQAITKGRPDAAGRLACLKHVVSLASVKTIALVAVALVCGITFPFGGVLVALALGVDAVSHYWADRRTTLAALAERVGKGNLARLGDGAAAPTGTGAYALDQSWHIAWLLVTALIAALGTTA